VYLCAAQLAKKPLAKGRANQRIEELEKQLSEVRSAHLKKVRALERQLELKQATAHLQPPPPPPSTSATAPSTTGSASVNGPGAAAATTHSDAAASNSSSSSSDAKTSEKATPSAEQKRAGPAPNDSTASSTSVQTQGANRLSELQEQLTRTQQQLTSLTAERTALQSQLQQVTGELQAMKNQHLLDAAAASTSASAALIPPPPGLNSAEYVSRLEGQFRLTQSQLSTACRARDSALEQVQRLERAVTDAGAQHRLAAQALEQQATALTGQLEFARAELARTQQTVSNLEWQLAQARNQPVRHLANRTKPLAYLCG
jgi:hypothetical protein